MNAAAATTNPPPLAGIKVVEITSIYSGPLAGVILAELGADVVKVESQTKPDLVRYKADGPYGVSPNFYALNRGKRFVSLDASTPRGREVLHDLVAGADVFLHNMRPGKPDAMGLDYASLAARNPRLIYASISGLGSEGPDSAQPVYDYVVQARIGAVDYQRDLATGRASLISQVVVDKTTSQATVQAVLAALYVRERTGLGQHIDLPMIGVGLHFEWADAIAGTHSVQADLDNHENIPAHLHGFPAAALLVIRTSDDGEIAFGAALPPFDGIAIALDRPDWIVDERFLDGALRTANFPAFHAEIMEAARKFTRDELFARFQENGVASALVTPRREVYNDPQLRHLGLVIDHTDPTLGPLHQPHPMWHFSDTPAVITTSMGRTGEHSRAVLAEAGLSDGAIEQLIAEGVVAVPD